MALLRAFLTTLPTSAGEQSCFLLISNYFFIFFYEERKETSFVK